LLEEAKRLQKAHCMTKKTSPLRMKSNSPARHTSACDARGNYNSLIKKVSRKSDHFGSEAQSIERHKFIHKTTGD